MTLSKSNKGTYGQRRARTHYINMYRLFRRRSIWIDELYSDVVKAARTSYKNRNTEFAGWVNKDSHGLARALVFILTVDSKIQATKRKNRKPSKLSSYEELINKLARAAQNYRIHDKLVNSKAYTQPGGAVLDGKFAYMEHSLRMTQAARYCQSHNMKIPDRLLNW